MGEQLLTDEQVLQNFLLDIRCLDKLLPWIGKFNIFDVLKISKNEIRHSNVLCWLLDPSENHGFGDTFIKGVFQRIVENDIEDKHDIFKTLLSDMYSFSVQREWKNIDILLVSNEEKIVLAIENKVSSQEHSDQLNRYRKIIEDEYPKFKRFYVYLTPDGEEPSDEENWDILTYSDIVEILEDLIEHFKLQQDISIMIYNYIEIIRRDIVEDQKLKAICNEIYNKHRKALDLIFENRIDVKDKIITSINTILLKLNDEGKIIHNEDYDDTVFRTEKMDKILPELSSPDSYWKSYNIYAYILEIDDECLYGVFKLTGVNIPKQDFKMIKKIIKELKPKDSHKLDFKSKTVFKTKSYNLINKEDIEEVEKVVRSIVNEILEMEKDLLSNINYHICSSQIR